MGKISSLLRQVRYTKGRANSFLKDTLASLIPKMNIQRGVDIFPTKVMALLTISGRYTVAPVTKKGSATAKPMVVGLSSAGFMDIYFLSLVRQKTPTV